MISGTNRTIGSTYWLEPEDVRFDTKLSMFNKDKSVNEYEALKYQINKYGQEEPILIRSNLCGDGVHRTRIARELGRKVLCIDVDPSISDKDYILKCNKHSFTGRNLTATQKAIKAYKLTKEFGYTDIEAMINLGIARGSKGVGCARYIDSSIIGRELNALDTLDSGKAIIIDGKATKSIEVAYKNIKLYEESNIKILGDAMIQDENLIDYNLLMETETAKNEFWKFINKDINSTDAKIQLARMFNAIYKS